MTHQSCFSMELIDRKAIQRSRLTIVKNMCQLDELLDILESKQIISESQREAVMSADTNMQRIRLFLDTIVRCGPSAFDSFKSALEQTNQSHIVDALLANKAELSANESPLNPVDSLPSVSSNKVVLDQQPSTVYRMEPYVVTSKPHGYVLIVNIENYISRSNISTRKGSSEDVRKLILLFEELSYNVSVLNDLNAYQLKRAIKDFSFKSEHRSVDACVLVVLSHGVEQNVIANDGGFVSVDWIISNFTNKNCPNLAGKPKLLLIQACRGQFQDFGVFVDKGQPRIEQYGDSVDHCFDSESLLSLPNLSDCVIVYTTLPGFVSWRSETEGSWYVTHFVEVVRVHGRQLHVLDLLTEVNNRLVRDSSSTQLFQISQPATTLRKPFFFTTVPSTPF